MLLASLPTLVYLSESIVPRALIIHIICCINGCKPRNNLVSDKTKEHYKCTQAHATLTTNIFTMEIQ